MSTEVIVELCCRTNSCLRCSTNHVQKTIVQDLNTKTDWLTGEFFYFLFVHRINIIQSVSEILPTLNMYSYISFFLFNHNIIIDPDKIMPHFPPCRRKIGGLGGCPPTPPPPPAPICLISPSKFKLFWSIATSLPTLRFCYPPLL
jgi:hypothetical protein